MFGLEKKDGEETLDTPGSGGLEDGQKSGGKWAGMGTVLGTHAQRAPLIGGDRTQLVAGGVLFPATRLK